jgi:peroxiredoxin Q/BCP
MFQTKTAQLAVGDQAPLFTLPDQHGKSVALASLLQAGPVVVFFYPKDNTTGCTAQACAFRDAYQAFQTAGAHVVGISSDSTESHRSFADQHGFSYSILSDTEQTVRQAFGVPKSLGLIAGRVTYILDNTGRIRHIFNSQLNIKGHISQALEQVQALTAH